MKACSLAVDIGASSGKVIAGYVENDTLHAREVHRFENRLIQKKGHLCWDIDQLFAEVKRAIHLAGEQGFYPESIGVDTWGVDFVLLDEGDRLLTDAVAYRDPRTDGMMEEVLRIVDKDQLYSITGIQFQKFNTIYQLYSLKKRQPDVLKKAKSFLMIPDYFHFLLSGKKVNEYTNATTTQLVNAHTKVWDRPLLDKLGIPGGMFQEIKRPQTVLGRLKPEMAKEFGLDMQVILPATHDTGSAVVAVPETQDALYISSGTWSLIGVENTSPVCDVRAMNCNFTNEGGVDGRYRFLKNIMGLWMIQEVKRNYRHRYSYADFADMARREKPFRSMVDVNDDRFLKPENMVREIQNACREKGQPVPETPGQVARCVFDSLAFSYRRTVEEMEELFGKTYHALHVIGGGSQNEMLNQLIADATNKTVVAGPVEATAIGNLAVQLMARGEIGSLEEARSIIRHSFPLKTYTPRNKDRSDHS